MSSAEISLIILILVVGQIFLGIPVAFATGLTAIGMALLLFGPDSVYLVAARIYGMVINYSLIAVPLFVMMGYILEKGGVMSRLFNVVQVWLGRLPGGLAVSVVFAGAVLAAMIGVAGAEIVALGLVALPEMLRRGYSKDLSLGVICASGSLGTMIPPSVLLIIYGLVTNQSIAKLFAASLIPGLLLAAVYAIYVVGLCYFWPRNAPSASDDEKVTLHNKWRVSTGAIIPGSLIVVVLGSIYLGLATPTEAAGIGIAGALGAVAINRSLSWKLVASVVRDTGVSLGPIMWVFFGANALISVYSLAGGIDFLNDMISGLEQPRYVILAFLILIFFVLGMLLDWISIVLLTIPVMDPVIRKLGFDPIWFGVIFSLMMQTSYLSPPFGPAAFYLKSVTGPDISLNDIFRSVLPFMILQILVVVAVVLIPDIALWFPRFVGG